MGIISIKYQMEWFSLGEGKAEMKGGLVKKETRTYLVILSKLRNAVGQCDFGAIRYPVD